MTIRYAIRADLVMIANYAKSNNISIEEAAAVRGAFLDDVKKLAGEEKVEFIPLITPRTIETQWNIVVS